MNNNYYITTTSTCDLTLEELAKRNIKYACFKFIIDNKEYEDNFYEDYPYEKFFNDIKEGMEPTTSQVGYGNYLEFFENLLKEGKDIIHICLSSAISGDYQTAIAVANELNETHSNKIYVIDSLSASSGQGLLTILAHENLEAGMNVLDNVNWLNEHKHNLHHWFISTDLSSYVRGGRISKTSGFFGTALKICPLLTMDDEGKLQPIEKIRTKQKALNALIEKMKLNTNNDYDGYCFIMHSLMENDALNLKEDIKKEFPKIKEINIYHIGTTIGSHTGPGTISIVFMGNKRA